MTVRRNVRIDTVWAWHHRAAILELRTSERLTGPCRRDSPDLFDDTVLDRTDDPRRGLRASR